MRASNIQLKAVVTCGVLGDCDATIDVLARISSTLAGNDNDRVEIVIEPDEAVLTAHGWSFVPYDGWRCPEHRAR